MSRETSRGVMPPPCAVGGARWQLLACIDNVASNTPTAKVATSLLEKDSTRFYDNYTSKRL